MVRIPRQCPAAGAASEGEQNSRNDNENDTTPFQFGAVRRAEFDFSLLPDTISPSIESSSANQEIHDASFTPPKPTLIPSLSITPSEPVSKRMCTPGITNQQDDTIINHLHAQLEGLDISGARSNLDMANMSHALQEVMTGRDSRSAPLHDQFSFASVSPSPGLSAHRRRSGSRNTLEKHDVRDEAPPNDRFNILAVQNSLRNTKRLMSELVGVLASSAVHDEPDSVMKSLHRQAYELSDFNCQSTRTVGFVGDSGAGKSSLLNSLLDYQDLARSSNSGGACTCVVTEFHFHEDVELALTVERFSEAEILLQLENLLQDYRHFNLNRSSIDSHEAVDLEKRAEVASDTFRVMFPVSFVVDKDTLIRDTASNALSTIKSWMQDVDGLAIPKRLSGLSATQCSMSLMELSSVTTSRRAAVWPWIKKIKVYLNAHILSKGLVLVDLPGLRDLNSARRNITERYLLKCDEIFVVASEGRVTTDEGVRSVVELANKARLSNIGIICTRSDEIKATEARKDWKGKMAAMKIQQKTEAIEQDISEIKGLEDEISSFYDIDNDDLTQEEVNELDLLHRKVRTTKGRLAGHQFDLKKFLITTRNADVEKKLVQLYKDEVPGDQLKVFCASNTVYWDNRKTPRDKAMPYLVLSGILAIREYCMTLVSESQYTAAAKYMRNDVQVLLGKLDLWVQSGQGSLSAERKAKIRSTLDTLERKLKMDLCGHTSTLRDIANFHKNEFNTKIYRPQSNHTGRWGTAARNASDDWSCVSRNIIGSKISSFN
ncbi:hypothetical protein SAMD00023353_3201020 [Rosellinia necatrix]|uniref:Dynamin N-terminal domain-containing protein n=1 Tax=Rosellinia necatrix TaxID=77044 RepID=A0A1S8A8N5_ROSNE|nr:hypothetical protein SAMD00023353_3201020 [Rosellinia necatrix]